MYKQTTAWFCGPHAQLDSNGKCECSEGWQENPRTGLCDTPKGKVKILNDNRDIKLFGGLMKIMGNKNWQSS